jgi:hypothetical protein
MKASRLLLVGFGVLLFSCAHHRDVRPGAEGVHTVIVSAEDQEGGSRDAISQANHFCEQYKKIAAFTTEEKKYVGSVDESTYKTGKNISKAAQIIGGATTVAGQRRSTKTAGGVVGLGGVIADQTLGKGYDVTMKFKCVNP